VAKEKRRRKMTTDKKILLFDCACALAMFVMLPFLLIFKSGFLVFGMICLALAAAFVTVLWITAEVIRER